MLQSSKGQSCSCPDFPIPIAGHAIAAEPPPQTSINNKVFVFGGQSTSGLISSVYMGPFNGWLTCPGTSYGGGSYAWTVVATLPAGPARGMSAVWSKVTNKIYLFGGQLPGGPSGLLNSVWEFDPTTYTFTSKAGMTTSKAFASAIEIDGLIYVAGGRSAAGSSAELEAYDPLSDSWTKLAAMPSPRHGSNIASPTLYIPIPTWTTNDQLLIIGGFNGVAARPEVFRYSISTGTWTTDPPLPRATGFGTLSLDFPFGKPFFLAFGMDGVTMSGRTFNGFDSTWHPIEIYPCDYRATRAGATFGYYGSLESTEWLIGGVDATNTIRPWITRINDFITLDNNRIYLTGYWEDGNIILQWNSAQLQGPGRFLIEVDTTMNGDYISVTESEAQINAYLPSGSYTIKDGVGGNPTNIRLKIIMLNGDVLLSNTVQVSPPAVEMDVQILPEGENIKIHGNYSFFLCPGIIEVMTLDGRVISSSHKPANIDEIFVPIPQSTHGIILVHIRSGTHMIVRKILL